MCLAIAPSSQRSNSLFARSWCRIASTPLKLFSFGIFFHLLVGTGILAYSNITNTQINTHALTSGFIFGLVPLFIFGFLLTWIPQKYAMSPVHYGRYTSIYLFFMLALSLLEAGSVFTPSLVSTGMVLLFPGWFITLQSIIHMHSWLRSDAQIFSRPLLLLLILYLAILLIETFKQLTGIHFLSEISLTALRAPLLIAHVLCVV